MTSLLFWIACLLVQESASLTYQAYESTSVASESVEVSNSSRASEWSNFVETKHSASPINSNEAPLFTTSVNDIECSNTEGCATPVNLSNTPTISPAAHSKITWQPITSKRISTEATPTNDDAVPFTYSQYNPVTSNVQDTTILTTNDDGENELDSEVKDVKAHFSARTSTVTDSSMKPANSSLSETNKFTSKSSDFSMAENSDSPMTENALAVAVEGTNTVMPNGELVVANPSASSTENIPFTLFSLLKYNTQDSASDTTQNYSTHAIPLEVHSISSTITPVPILFSSSVYTDQSTVILTSQSNEDNTFHENSLPSTSKIPDVLSTETTNLEAAANLSKEIKNILKDLRSSTVAEHSESNMPLDNESTLWTSEQSAKSFSSTVSGDSRSLELNDETAFKTTNMPYTYTVKVQENTKPSATTSETLTESESHVQMYSVNVSEKEISEGHGLRRNLSQFIPSTDHSLTTTGLQNDEHTESNPVKDVFSTKQFEMVTSSSNINEAEFPTVTPEKVTKIEVLDKRTREETISSIPTVELFSRLPNVSEEIKSPTSVVNTESSTLATDPPVMFTTSHTVNGVSLEDKKQEVTSITSLLPKSMETLEVSSEKSVLTTEVSYMENTTFVMPISTTESLYTEKIMSEKLVSTTELSITEGEMLNVSSSDRPTLEENRSSDSVAEISGRSNPSVSVVQDNAQLATKQITDRTSSSIVYDSTTPSNINYIGSKESEATTINFPFRRDFPSTVPAITLSGNIHEETELSHSVVDQSSESLFKTTNSPITSTHPTTVRWIAANEDSVTTTVSPMEQTASVPSTSLTHLSFTSPSVTHLSATSTPKTQLPASTITSVSTASSNVSMSTMTVVSDHSFDQPVSTTALPISDTNLSTTSDDFHLPLMTSVVALDYSAELSTHPSILPTSTTKKETVRTESIEADVTTHLSTTTLNIPFYSTFSTTQMSFTQGETRRGGKHIPFSTESTKRGTFQFSENGIIHVTSTDLPAENDSKVLYKQMRFDELSLTEKANIITVTIQLSYKYFDEEEVHEKMTKVHSWLINVLMKEFQNWTLDPFQEANDDLNAAPFGNISIFYISPTPEMNSSGITLTFIAYNAWKNETLQVDFVLGILNYYSKELKASINASAAYFYHGYVAGDHYLMSAVLERYGVIIVTICLAVVLILLLVCVVIFYRKKTRRSVHCVSNSKFKQNMQEAVGIDLNPAIVILQDEKSDKVGNGNKICDDEGWLAPINDVPQAEDTNVPFIQDTKL